MNPLKILNCLTRIPKSFFAYETMPLVEAFCKRFNLLVEESQEETVGAADASRLIASWRSHNARAMGAIAEIAKEEDWIWRSDRHTCRNIRTATEFQERGKCFELFPGESLDDAARRRIFWFVD